MKSKEPLKITTESKNKKIYFEENGKTLEKVNSINESINITEKSPKKPQKKKGRKDFREEVEIGTRWYQIYDEYNSNELADIKDNEMRSFEEHCKKCFTEELDDFRKSKIQHMIFIHVNKF